MSRFRLPLLGLMMLGLLLMISAAMPRPVAAGGMGDCCAISEMGHHGTKTALHHDQTSPPDSHLAHGALCDLICAGGFSLGVPHRLLPKAARISQLHPLQPEARPEGQGPPPHLRPPIPVSV